MKSFILQIKIGSNWHQTGNSERVAFCVKVFLSKTNREVPSNLLLLIGGESAGRQRCWGEGWQTYRENFQELDREQRADTGGGISHFHKRVSLHVYTDKQRCVRAHWRSVWTPSRVLPQALGRRATAHLVMGLQGREDSKSWQPDSSPGGSSRSLIAYNRIFNHFHLTAQVN